MSGKHAIGQQLAELVLRPSVHDAVNDLVQIGPRVDVVCNAGRDDGENGARPLGAIVEPCEEPVFATEDKSRFILPVSRFAQGSITPGIPRLGSKWTSCTESRVEAKTFTSAFGPTDRGL
jgi:hypothetical protein